MLWSILGLIAIVSVWGFLLWERHDMASAYVYGDLAGKKARDITIRPDWLDFDRDSMTYDVEYTAADGVRKANSCKVNVGPQTDHKVYWAHPI